MIVIRCIAGFIGACFVVSAFVASPLLASAVIAGVALVAYRAYRGDV